MRVFFGLEPDPATQQAIANWRDRYGLAAGRPVPTANFHVTLAFIGEVSDRKLDILCQTVDEHKSGKQFVAGTLLLDQAGFWPGPGIYWLGASRPPPSLNHLARKLQQLGGLVGARLQRKTFTPHVTLYRNCGEPPPAPVSPPAVDLVYDHFTLFESRAGQKNVTYHPLARWDLGRAHEVP